MSNEKKKFVWDRNAEEECLLNETAGVYSEEEVEIKEKPDEK